MLLVYYATLHKQQAVPWLFDQPDVQHIVCLSHSASAYCVPREKRGHQPVLQQPQGIGCPGNAAHKTRNYLPGCAASLSGPWGGGPLPHQCSRRSSWWAYRETEEEKELLSAMTRCPSQTIQCTSISNSFSAVSLVSMCRGRSEHTHNQGCVWHYDGIRKRATQVSHN